jgi:hypothetical protein
MDGNEETNGRAWRSFCERMAALADRSLTDDRPSRDRHHSDEFRYLVDQRRRSTHVAWREHT